MKMYRLGVVLFLVCAIPLFASVDLDVGSGIVVETSSGVKVEIDGVLTETGYFKGEITSGSRTGMTSFAGMTLGIVVLDGSITRFTGAAYSGGNGDGTNMKRYYELINTTTDTIAPTMTVAYVSSGSNDEENGLAGPYFAYRYTTNWAGFRDSSTTSTIYADTVEVPPDTSEWILSEGVRVAVKVFLEGPYCTDGDTMTTILGPDSSDVIPLTSPHAEDPRTCSSIPSGVTDWVLVQVRSTVDGSALGSRSCFLKNDGTIVGDDGCTAYVGVCCMPDDYYLVIQHRNHLAIETSSAVTGLTWGTTPSSAYDFTTGTGQYHGSDACELGTGVYGMYAGDANHNQQVQNTDKNDVWKIQVGQAGYRSADFDLNGQVQNSDKNDIWKANVGKGTQVSGL